MSIRTWLDSLDDPPAAAVKDAREARELAASFEKFHTAADLGAFNPRTEVSADAKYIVRSLVIWFLVVPVVLAVIVWAITR